MTATGTSTEQIAAIAQEWVVRLASREIGEADLHAFEAWLADSAANRTAFEQARSCWLQLNKVASLRPTPDSSVAARAAWRPLALAAGVAAIAAGVVFFLDPLTRLQADAMTAVGDVHRVALPDGSIAVLDTSSAIDIQYGGGERRIRLLRGRAWFDVKSNPARPFVVRARNIEATAKGTSYGVSLRADGAVVEVTKGQVEVTSKNEISALHAGEKLTVSAGAATRGALPQDPLAWRVGRIQIENATLPEAIAQLDRYRPGRVFVLGNLPQTRVDMSVSVAETDRALTSLAESQSLKRIDLTRWLTVLTPQ